MDQAIDQGLEDAEHLSMGPYSQVELARRDHPFALRHGSPQLDPGVINEQTGRFLRAWKRSPVVNLGDTITAEITNNSPEADFLKTQTRFTFRRPIADEIEECLKADLEKKLKEQIDAFSKQTFEVK